MLIVPFAVQWDVLLIYFMCSRQTFLIQSHVGLFRLFSIIVYYKILNIVPCAIY